MVATGDNSTHKDKLRNTVVGSLINEFNFNSPDKYFLFVGMSDGWTGGDDIPELKDSREEDSDIRRNIIAMKRIDSTDVFFMATRYDWTSGTIYDMYDDTAEMDGKKYYAMNSEYNVYKCLYNNNQASSIEPKGVKTYGSMTTADGYVWKYMFTIPEPHRYYIDDELIPVNKTSTRGTSTETKNQWTVQQNAKSGSIDMIFVDHTDIENNPNWGSGAAGAIIPHKDDNYIGIFALAGATGIMLNTSHKQASPDFYKGLVITITRGFAAGTRRIITSYNETSNTVIFDDVLSSDVPKYSTYEIAPRLTVSGDGVSADAYINLYDWDMGFTNPERKQTESISISNSGKNYTYANVSFSPKDVIEDVTNGETASARAIMSPLGGNGSNATTELNCKSVLIVVNIDEDEDGDIVSKNEIRQYGIIKNPILNDTDILDKYGNPYRIAGTEILQNTVLEVSPSSSGFLSQDLFTVGKYVMGKDSKANAKIVDWGPSIEGNNGLLTINNLNGRFISPIDDSSTGEGVVEFDQVGDVWNFTETQIAQVSGFEEIFTNNVPLYNCTWILGVSNEANPLSNTSFLIDTSVTGGSGTSSSNEPNGKCLDWVVDDSLTGGNLIVTDVKGIFNVGDSIGSSLYSSTTSVINSILPPDISVHSGEIIYTQNMKPIDRGPEQRERYQIILKF